MTVKAVRAERIELGMAHIPRVKTTNDLVLLWSEAELSHLPPDDLHRLMIARRTLYWLGRYAAPRKDEDYDKGQMARHSEVLTIQYLRAVAAIAVVIFHIGLVLHLNLAFGAAGVDLFFVISGFIMWMVTRQRKATPLKFIRKRLLRIVPLYWLVTIFVAACASFRPNLFPLNHPTFQHILLSLLFIPHLSPDGGLFPLLNQGWTLNYEMFFYFLFALTLAGSRKYQFYALSAVLVGFLLCGYLVHPLSPIEETYTPPGETYTSPLLMEFLAGVYICRAWHDDKVLSRTTAWVAIALGVAGIGLTYCLRSELPRVIGWGIPAALIVAGAVSLEAAMTIRRIGFLKLLGDASYSIYLTHGLSWVAVSIAVVRLGGGNPYGPQIYPITVCAAVVAACAAVVGGIATYVFIEKPMGRLLSRP
jgi:exopolysaccharide production protein ExoZ